MNFSKYAILAFLGASLLSLTSVCKWFEIINISSFDVKAKLFELDKDDNRLSDKGVDLKEQGGRYSFWTKSDATKIVVTVAVSLVGGSSKGIGKGVFDLTESDLTVKWNGTNFIGAEELLDSVPSSSSSSVPAPITFSPKDSSLSFFVPRKSPCLASLCPTAKAVKKLLMCIPLKKPDFGKLEKMLLLEAQIKTDLDEVKLSTQYYSPGFGDFLSFLDANEKKINISLKETHAMTGGTKCSYHREGDDTVLLSFVLK